LTTENGILYFDNKFSLKKIDVYTFYLTKKHTKNTNEDKGLRYAAFALSFKDTLHLVSKEIK